MAASRPPLPPVILFQALPKGPRMDLIVRQAAEGGLAEVVPFVSEHTVPRIGAGESGGGPENRVRRWEKIIREARQQSGSSSVSSVSPPLGMEELFGYWGRLRAGRRALALLIHETPLAKCGFHGYLETVPELVVMAGGPEGGFSPREAASFMDAGFKPVTLGNTILRAENAALYSIAVVRTLIFARHTWTMKKC